MKLLRYISFALCICLAGACALISGGSLQHDTMEAPEINEASGLAASQLTPGLLYTHNDSGGEAAVYVINKRGFMPAKIMLKGVKNRDWEDIAVGRDPRDGKSYVFVGEIGDNVAKYNSVFIYRFAEPELTDTLLVVNRIDRIEFTYPDGPRDAEALFSDPLNGDLYVISKREAEVGVYRLPYPQSYSQPNIAEKVATLPYNWVTAADISPDGKRILVKTYNEIYRYKRGRNASIAEALQGKFRKMPYTPEEQGEAIAWDHQGKGYFTLSEQLGEIPVELYYYK